MVKAWGGPTIGKVANHIAPDTLYDNQLAEFAPYKTPGDHGSVARAKAAMKGSKYDTKGDGTCGAPECKGALMLVDARAVYTKMLPVVEAQAQKIGITFTVRTINDAYPALQTPSRNIAIGEFPGWVKDYADPLTFFSPLFDGRSIIPSGNVNYSLVGITPSQATKVGVKGSVAHVPNVDAVIDRCAAAAGRPRRACYESLDRYLMTQVVPWVPYLWQYQAHITGPHVARWVYDQFSGGTAYAHVAVS
jgi:ABC-type oligopeptide transport system substrate-binding subunit